MHAERAWRDRQVDQPRLAVCGRREEKLVLHLSSSFSVPLYSPSHGWYKLLRGNKFNLSCTLTDPDWVIASQDGAATWQQKAVCLASRPTPFLKTCCLCTASPSITFHADAPPLRATNYVLWSGICVKRKRERTRPCSCALKNQVAPGPLYFCPRG